MVIVKNKIEEFVATGRRKTSVAGVRLRVGTGQIKINNKLFAEYFPDRNDQKAVLAPLDELELYDKYDLLIRLHGGGKQGQVEAVRLGISRALVKENMERRPSLKALGFLRRDARKKERKKFGLRKARKSFQFSKR